MPLISSSPDRRKQKPRGARKDRRGDEHGVIQRAPDGASREDIISIRWIAHRLRDCSGVNVLDREDDDFAENVDDIAASMAWGAAAWRVFRLLWSATGHRVRAGMVYDGADLLVTGRYGTAEQIVENILAGRYTEAPRDGDGFLILDQDGE